LAKADENGNTCKIGVNTADCNAQLSKHIAHCMVPKNNVLALLKSRKNATEQEGMRNANIRDCAALMKYFSYLEEQLKNPGHGLDEHSAAQIVAYERSQGENFVGLSFQSISSMGPNGAVIHYAPSGDGTARAMNNDEIYLLDSGAQYLDVTTDITRTNHFGGKPPTAFQKNCYTRVLLGVLGLERVTWPSNGNITGASMDILARQHLWKVGLDFKHGTGHGVGSYLNVHEGPQEIHALSKVKLEEGMCVSNEPGYYKDGEFGIRIENVQMCQKHPDQ